MIRLNNVYMSYGGNVAALHDVSLHIAKGEFVYVTGASGAGKTTLMKLFYLAHAPARGQILIDGQNITRFRPSQIPYLRRDFGVVFQDFKLLPNRTVLENVGITLEVLGWNKKDIGKRVYHVLKQMGLEHKVNATPQRLSGGEQQRIALARALVNEPKILLADEPTGNLDEATAKQVMTVLKEANIRGTTVVVATHDRHLLEKHPRRVIQVENGRIAGDGDEA